MPRRGEIRAREYHRRHLPAGIGSRVGLLKHTREFKRRATGIHGFQRIKALTIGLERRHLPEAQRHRGKTEQKACQRDHKQPAEHDHPDKIVQIQLQQPGAASTAKHPQSNALDVGRVHHNA